MSWRPFSGFNRRRGFLDYFYANGVKFQVIKAERINGQWKASRFYHAFADSDYLGYSTTRDGAKLICVLYLN